MIPSISSKSLGIISTRLKLTHRIHGSFSSSPRLYHGQDPITKFASESNPYSPKKSSFQQFNQIRSNKESQLPEFKSKYLKWEETLIARSQAALELIKTSLSIRFSKLYETLLRYSSDNAEKEKEKDEKTPADSSESEAEKTVKRDKSKKPSKKTKSDKESESKSSEEKEKGEEEEVEDEKDDEQRSKRWIQAFAIGGTIVLTAGLFSYFYGKETADEIYFNQMVRDLWKEDLIERLEVINSNKVRVVLAGGSQEPRYYLIIPSLRSFEIRMEQLAHELGIPAPQMIFKQEVDPFVVFLQAVPTLAYIGINVALLYMLFSFISKRLGSMGGSGGFSEIAGMTNSKAKKFKKGSVDISFKDVAGCDEAKLEIQEFVNFLKFPEKYQHLGAKIPKGALLTGSPGTGKTLLAKATAGEADVPFFSVSGSDFNELFVGVGAARVRDLFAQARAQAPSIVFIDEIDAIGRKRSQGGMRNDDERDATLNQLLTEMDGFETAKKPVIVLAGTNLPDVLDPALKRPGRFDRNIHLELPDIRARNEILMVHLKKLKLASPIESYARRISSMSPGFSGADLANICNEAALIAARKDKEAVDMHDFESAVERVVAGLERKSLVLPLEQRKTVAFHEAGHVVTSWFLEFGSPLLKVTIIPRGRGLGYAMYMPEDYKLHTQQQLFDRICVTLGGRAAEELTFGEITSGAQDDLQKITQMTYALINEYGMSDVFGPISFGSIRGSGSFEKPFSEDTGARIDREVRAYIAQAYDRTKSILQQNWDKFQTLAKSLEEKESLSYEDCEAILGVRPWAATESQLEYQSSRRSHPPHPPQQASL